MKKILIATCIAGSFLASCNSAPSTAKFKSEYIKGCIEEAKKTNLPNLTDDIVKNYCNCASENVVTKLSDEERKKLAANPNDATNNARHMEVIKGCIEDLQKSISAKTK